MAQTGGHLASKFSILQAALNANATSSAKQTTNVSQEERMRYLDELQEVTSQIMIPAMVFLLLLAVTGLVGNSLVLFVYSQRFIRTSTRVYILVIAALDIIANVIGIPGEIYDMFHIWDFDNRELCRARLFFNSFSTLSSAMVLLAVAVTRYRKVCAPYGWQTTVKQSRIISLILVCLGVLFSVPYVIISGKQTKKTDRPDVTGFECTVDDDFADTIWPLLNNGFFLLLYISCSIPLIVLYIKIGVQAWKHSTVHGSSSAAGQRSHPANSSSMDNQEVLSSSCSVKSKKSIKNKKSRAAPSSGSEDASSVAGELSETCFHRTGSSDKYVVRILEDSVEITTPMMGQFIVQLKKASDVGEVETLVGNEIETNSIHSKAEDSKTKQLLCSNFSNPAVSGFENQCFTQDEAAVCVSDNRDQHLGDLYPHKSKPNHNVLNKEISEVSFHHGDGHTQTSGSVNLNQCSNKQPLLTQLSDSSKSSAETTAASADTDNGLCGQLDSTDQNKDHEHLAEQEQRENETSQSPTKFDATNVTSPRQDDPTSSLRWVDIVFCPQTQEDVPGQNNHRPQPRKASTAPLSFRMSPSNALLQRTEWLRNLISVALARKKDRKREEVFVCDETVLSVKIPQTFPIETDVDEDVFAKSFSSQEIKTPTRKSGDLTSRLKSVLSLRKHWRKFSFQMSSQSKRRPLGRTTAMLIIISAVFVAGFIPYLILIFFKLAAPGSYASMTFTEHSIYNLFLRTYFINCAVNPIIYSFCDNNFRRECIKLMKCSKLRQ
ncbi:muscarinic acetylcholine receptor gar-3 [Biomphalaria glabrata]|nr:muscarinic acetylcholine receptor gar-3 [Biomphalaria glabrata]